MNEYEINSLLKKISELESELKYAKKYGLVWNKEINKEDIVLKCENNIPILFNDKSKTIINGSNNNILIEGDNFHVLTSLNYILKESIDLIYIDPPYNTGNEDFTYNDRFVNKDDGYRHSKWLNFIEKRLYLCREILKQTGVIFISIDDNEQSNLKLLCDKVFGEKNFIGNLIWISNPNGRGDSKFLGTINEYVLAYKKDECLFNYEPQDLTQFNLKDEKGIYAEQILHSKLSYSIGMDYPIEAPDGSLIYAGNVTKEEWEKRKSNQTVKKAMTWRYGKETFQAELSKGDIVFHQKNGVWKVYRKRRPTKSGSAPYKNFYSDEGTRHGSNQIKEIFNGQTLFDHPKPVGLIKYLLKLLKYRDAVVLDFFAGSGTTGQAVLELNKEDGGNRRFILCTNNENNICTDVTYPRLKTVITGTRTDGSKYSEGIRANLYYFKTDFVKDEKNSDQAKYNLVEKVDALLCITENIFNEIERNDYSSHYANENRHLFIFNDYFNNEKFNEFKNSVLRTPGEKIVYVYSSDNNLDENLIVGENITVKPIPSKIYEIYKEIVEDIKRG